MKKDKKNNFYITLAIGVGLLIPLLNACSNEMTPKKNINENPQITTSITPQVTASANSQTVVTITRGATGNSSSVSNTPTSKLTDDNDKGVITTFADINNDGSRDRLVVDLESIEGTESMGDNFFIYNKDNKLLFSTELSVAHYGFNSFHLCKQNGRNYIFEYSPFTNMGETYVSYKVFNFDSNNKMAVLESGSCTPKSTDAEFAELDKRIEYYMKNSTIIIDTIWSNPPLYSTSDKMLDSYQYHK